MSELNLEAQAKGLTFLNELGLDPGIDHLTAKKIIDEEVHNGNTVCFAENKCFI